jgi:hypothetical protein
VLTGDDKQWITERLEKVNVGLRTEFAERLGKVETSLRTEFIERLEKVETTLLTEFHKWTSPLELRQKSHAAAIRALDTEVDSLSDRLKNLEGH